jgi:hypothetical protein
MNHSPYQIRPYYVVNLKIKALDQWVCDQLRGAFSTRMRHPAQEQPS